MLSSKLLTFNYNSSHNCDCDPIVDYEKINPIKYVPALVDGDFVVSDSLAIILVSYILL